jgi:hypothetical protein
MQETCSLGEKCDNSECTFVHFKAPKKLIKCYQFFGKGCAIGDACPFLHGSKDLVGKAQVVEEGRVKRPSSEVLPSPEKKVKVVTEEDAKVATTPSNAPKILTLDEIKSKKQARRVKKTVKAEGPAPVKPAEPEGLKKVLTLEEIKAKKAKRLVTPPQTAPEGQAQTEKLLASQPQKRPSEAEDPEPVKKPKVEAEQPAADLPEPSPNLQEKPADSRVVVEEVQEVVKQEQVETPKEKLKKTVFALINSQEESELTQRITSQLTSAEGIEELVSSTSDQRARDSTEGI